MIAVFVNAIAVIFGGTVGLLLKSRIKERFSQTVMAAIALVVAVMGVLNAIGTKDVLGMIICLAIGSLLGEWMKLDDGLNKVGEYLKSKVDKGGESNNRFTEAYVTTSLIYCVGSMAVMGSIEAGINGNYTILFSKSLIDGITAVGFAATMGVGVLFSALTILVIQGGITLLAQFIAPFLSAEIITQMSAIGGCLLIAMSINMLGLGQRIRLVNMLPAIFLPIVYIPFAAWISTII